MQVKNPFSGDKATVPARVNEHGEWHVKFYKGGKRHADGDYFTDCSHDALATAYRMVDMMPNPEQMARLDSFRRANGPHWALKLIDLWRSGQDDRQQDGHLLRQVRNSFGPSWLMSFPATLWEI